MRIITAVIGVSIVIPAIVLSAYGNWLFCVVVSIVSYWEFVKGMGIRKRRYIWTSILGGISLWLMVLLELIAADWVEIPSLAYQLVVLLILPIIGIVALFNKEEHRPVETVGTMVLGYIYVVLPFFLLFRMSIPGLPGSYNFLIPLGILWLTWTLDVMAYTFGKITGNHPLFPRVSPKKTWEGAVGGVVFCLGMAVLMEVYLPQSFSWLVIALITSFFSQLGDLVESMFKRSVALKDSGKLLPGHGGMLDRFDGMLISLPIIYLYMSLLEF